MNALVTKERIQEILESLEDPFLHKTFKETEGIEEIKVKEEKEHVSVKLLIGKTNTAEQMELQQHIVNKLKGEGAATVGLRFDQLPEETLEKLQPEAEQQQETNLLGQTGTKFLTIASGKGGVGKSTVTVNLAIALARLGKKVGIIDADIYGFSVPDMMGVEKRPVVRGEKIIPVERFDVKLISMGFFVEDNSPIIWRRRCSGKC